jgi:choline dehydrogenase-like flavoprotein
LRLGKEPANEVAKLSSQRNMLQIVAYPKVYDVVIVGSGAGGGIAAYVLNKAGAKCLMLEGGSWYDTGKESKMFAWNYEAPHRGAQTSEKP